MNFKFETTQIRLRKIEPADLPTLYQHQLDPDGNRMAFMHPRNQSDFNAHWDRILRDVHVTVRTVVVGDVPGGCISSFPMDGRTCVGYWIGKPFWGNGVATRALELFLGEISVRPLHARVATTNTASLRVLEKCGFSVATYEMSCGSDRLIACEEAVLELV